MNLDIDGKRLYNGGYFDFSAIFCFGVKDRAIHDPIRINLFC